jgi:hypothetical protein
MINKEHSYFIKKKENEMNIEFKKDVITGTLFFNGEITVKDMVQTNFTWIDKKFLNEPINDGVEFLESVLLIFKRKKEGTSEEKTENNFESSYPIPLTPYI